MEFDLNKKVLCKFSMKGKIYYIEYESIHIINFHCGKYKYLVEGCSDKSEMPLLMMAQNNSNNEKQDSMIYVPKLDYTYSN